MKTQPLPIAAPGVPLSRFTVEISTWYVATFKNLSRFWAVATLLDADGEPLEGLSGEAQLCGTTCDSAHAVLDSSTVPGPDNNGLLPMREIANFHFDNLVITQPGHYMIRIILVGMDFPLLGPPEGRAIAHTYADTCVISVEETRPGKQTCQTARRDSNKTRPVWCFHHPITRTGRQLHHRDSQTTSPLLKGHEPFPHHQDSKANSSLLEGHESSPYCHDSQTTPSHPHSHDLHFLTATIQQCRVQAKGNSGGNIRGKDVAYIKSTDGVSTFL